ncbi:hypothetical protein EG68_08264 [Paragonimus skrjabini miyazakii]|uniref:Uncharacterized protein n=1 Tax=Paragonimus skrjabini miyazakii TaxID=59628 RepID=A0A8S9YMA3_9TREM|nr:hypothetical protein EG68_08264 [Paragonimus skrjabini miyazakii]
MPAEINQRCHEHVQKRRSARKHVVVRKNRINVSINPFLLSVDQFHPRNTPWPHQPSPSHQGQTVIDRTEPTHALGLGWQLTVHSTICETNKAVIQNKVELYVSSVIYCAFKTGSPFSSGVPHPQTSCHQQFY